MRDNGQIFDEETLNAFIEELEETHAKHLQEMRRGIKSLTAEELEYFEMSMLKYQRANKKVVDKYRRAFERVKVMR